MVKYYENLDTTAFEKLGIYEKPFEINPDYRFQYLPTKQFNILFKIMKIIESKDVSTFIIWGESGSGKTSLARRIEFKLSLCRHHYPLIINIERNLDNGKFWKMLIKYFNLEISEKLENNKKTLLDFLNANTETVNFDLIIDDAELLNREVRKSLIDLDSWENNGKRLLQIMLFMTTKEDPKNIGYPLPNFRLEPFDFYETRKMIEYRLFICGSPQLFTERAIERIFEVTKGSPRRVLYWCRECLEYISQTGKPFIDEIEIEKIQQVMLFYPNE